MYTYIQSYYFKKTNLILVDYSMMAHIRSERCCVLVFIAYVSARSE
jgi:hypothetical protein